MTSQTPLANPARTTSAALPGTRSTGTGSPSLSGAGLATVLLGQSLPVIDFFIVNVALPTIDDTLHASTATLELVVAGYGIAYALLMVLGGRLGDAFGRRRLFLTGLAAFTVTSLICGLAPTATVLVLARIAQGGAAALMLPQVLSTIQATTSGERRSRALGLFGANASIIGQLLGGLLVTANVAGLEWRPIFLVNVPIGIAGLLLARRTVPETRVRNPIGVDVPGTALLAVSLLTLLVPLMEGGALGWPGWIWLVLGAFPLAVTGFVLVERRAERAGRVPLLPPSVLRVPSMRNGLVLAVPFFLGFSGFMFVYAITLQVGLHLNALESGIALTPMAVGALSASLGSSRLVTRLGRRSIPLGLAVQGLGIAVLIGSVLLAWPDLGPLALAPGMVITGLGQGLAMVTLFRVVLSQVPVDRAGVGSGALATTQQTSLALGVATLGTLFATLSAPSSLGVEGAFLLVLGVQVVISGALAIGARVLPDPR
jgi:MFS family permease